MSELSDIQVVPENNVYNDDVTINTTTVSFKVE